MPKTSRLLVTADVHIHPFKVCSRDNGADRLRDGLAALRQTLDYAVKHDATWVMAGDFKMPKTNWPQEALTGSLEVMRRYRDDVRMVMIAGNHDAMGLGGSGLQPFSEVATVIDGEAQEMDGILYVPHGADLRPVKTNKHLPLVAHAFLAGAVIGAEDLQLRNVGIDLAEYGQPPVAFFGDIHGAQVRRAAVPPYQPKWERLVGFGVNHNDSFRGEVFYPGSPYQQNWGERNQLKGCLLVDLPAHTVSFLPIDAPSFVHEELLDPEIFPARLERMQGNNFVRIITPSEKWTRLALEAKKLTFRWLQITETKVFKKSQKRTVVHAAMDKKAIIAEYIKARPIPEGVTVEQAQGAMENLWSVER